MIELKVRNFGNPLGVVLPTEVINQAKDIIGRYSNTLHELAK